MVIRLAEGLCCICFEVNDSPAVDNWGDAWDVCHDCALGAGINTLNIWTLAGLSTAQEMIHG